MGSITLKAPAKVNLFLKILRIRKDGYHDIHTLFEKIDISDIITVTPISRGIKVTSDRPITRDPKDNIVYKAAGLLIKKFGIKSGVSIHIKKRIPMAAGLGGGSSDAATVLKGMNRLFDLNIGRKRMAALAVKLGADVPFFVSGAAFAIGKGVGERLKPLNIGKKLWHLVIFPGFKSPTKGVYEAFDRGDFALTLTTPGVRIHPSISSSTGLRVIEAMLYNDLQCAAISEKKVLGIIIERLTASLGKKVLLSGSGPSVFCLYPSGKEALKAKAGILKKIPPQTRKRWEIFAVKTENFEE